jgi:hypothetical protein
MQGEWTMNKRIAIYVCLVGIAAVCAAELGGSLDSILEVAEAIGFCPVQEPPPIPCYKTVCIASTGQWGYQTLPSGAQCQGGTGVCDGHGHCVIPQPGPRTLAISSDTLNGAISSFLWGDVSLDTTGNAPPLVFNQHIECTEGPGPIGQICVTVGDTHYSYVKLSNTPGDPLNFPIDLSTECNWAFCINVNQIHGSLNAVSVGFGQSSSGPSVLVSIPLQSADPTLLIDFPAPNVQLSNKRLSLQGTLAINGAGNGLAISSAIDATLDFDRNLTNFPDWLLDPFYDIDGEIRDQVRSNVASAFSIPARKNTLNSALNSAINLYAQLNVPGFTGIRSITAVRAASGTLFIDFIPN